VRWNGLGELPAGDVADAQVPDQALVPQRGQRGEPVAERLAAAARQAAHAQVDQVQNVDTEVAEVLLDRRAELAGRGLAVHLAVGPAQRADLGGDGDACRIRAEGLAQDVAGAAGPGEVEGGGVEVAGTEPDGPARTATAVARSIPGPFRQPGSCIATNPRRGIGTGSPSSKLPASSVMRAP
jgi:hypothetical protein